MSDYRIKMHPDPGWEERGESRVSQVVCPRCGATVSLNPQPVVHSGWHDWGAATSNLLERFHCPEPAPQVRWWLSRAWHWVADPIVYAVRLSIGKEGW